MTPPERGLPDVDFAAAVKTRRLAARLTQEELAARAGVNVRSIRDIERGRVRHPRPATARLLGVALGLTGAELNRFVAQARTAYWNERDPPAEQPPAWSRPAQLPIDVPGFVGRDVELAALDRLATRQRLAAGMVIGVVSGTAGVGKTALAVRWANRVGRRFPDGHLYLNLQGFSPGPAVRPAVALGRMLRSFGVPAERVPAEVDEAAALYRSVIAGRRVLVLLDNAADADQVRPLLPGTPGSLVLVTSRHRLGGLIAREGADSVALGVLPPDQAHELLGRLLPGDRPHGAPDAVEEMARLCGYLPLALRVAAANVTGQPARTVAEYNRELAGDGRLARLRVAGDERATVSAAFDLSYQALPPAARRLFRLLGLAPGPDIGVRGAAALIDDADVLSTLDYLVAASLVERAAAGRYAMHDLVRLFAAERAFAEEPEPERHAAVGRLVQHYYAYADHASRLLFPQMLRVDGPSGHGAEPDWSGQPDALDWLDAESANLVAAIDQAEQHGAGHLAPYLADALRGYFTVRNAVTDWHSVARTGLRVAEAGGDRRAVAAGRISLAALGCHRHQVAEAKAHAEAALRLCDGLGWVEGQVTALGYLAVVHAHLGEPVRAARHFAVALARNRRTGREGAAASMLGNLSVVARELGRLDEAIGYAREAIAINEAIGSRSGLAVNWCSLGECYHARGDLDIGYDCLNRADEMYRQLDYRMSGGEALRARAGIMADLDRLDEALSLARTALRVAMDGHNRLFEVQARNTLANVRYRLGQHRPACAEFELARASARDGGFRSAHATALLGLTSVYGGIGDLEAARGYAEAGIDLVRSSGHRLVYADLLTALAGIHLSAGSLGEARTSAARAMRIHRLVDRRLGLAQATAIRDKVAGLAG